MFRGYSKLFASFIESAAMNWLGGTGLAAIDFSTGITAMVTAVSTHKTPGPTVPIAPTRAAPTLWRAQYRSPQPPAPHQRSVADVLPHDKSPTAHADAQGSGPGSHHIASIGTIG